MRSVNQKIEERLNRWLKDIKAPILWRIRGCTEVIPYEGAEDDRRAIDEYCLYRIAEGMNEYLLSSNYSAVIRQRQYEKFKKTLMDICSSHHIEDRERFTDLLEVPIVSDSGIAMVKALHPRKGKSKEDLVEELGISERMVRLNIRKLDHKLMAENGEDPGEFRLGGQLMSVPIKVKEDANGKRIYYTPNTMQPLVMQLSIYQTTIILDSLWKEYETESGIAIELAASIWGQLSDYSKDRIRFVWGSSKPGFEDFLDEVEELLEDGYVNEFRSERELFISDTASVEDRLQIAYKSRIYLNIYIFGQVDPLRHVRVEPRRGQDGKLLFRAYSVEECGEDYTEFYTEDVRDITEDR